MLKSIELTDFQSHLSTFIPLDPFTVIVGSSSSGKSAVVRALRLAVENARGTSFVRQGAKSTRVALQVADGPSSDLTEVVVERGKSVSTYRLRRAGLDTDPVVFTKCATSVPDAVASALSLGDSKLWIAGQFDRPFLLDETGSEVARVLGKLTNVTMIFAAVRESNRRASEARRSHSAKSLELEQVRVQVEEYSTLPLRLQALARAEAALARAEELSSRRARLLSYAEDLRDAQRRFVAARSLLRPVPSIERLVALSGSRASLSSRYQELLEAIKRRSSVQTRLVCVPSIDHLDKLAALLTLVRSIRDDLCQSQRLVARLSQSLQDSIDAVEMAHSEFTSALTRAGECPLCGASTSSAQIHLVV